jgi:hypothetical protein
MADQSGAGAAAPAAGAAGAPTDPPKPTPGAAGAAAAGDPGAGPAAGTPGDGTLLTDPPKGGEKDPAKPGDGKQPDGTPTGAPEKYGDFKLPEGVTVDPEAMTSFQTTAKEMNLTQEQAQKLVDFQAGLVQKSQEAMVKGYDELKTAWRDESIKSLGPKADEQLAFAAKTRERFGSPELNEILKETGLGNHPAIVKLFVGIGKAISEDNLAEGTPAGGEKSVAERIFGSATKK